MSTTAPSPRFLPSPSSPSGSDSKDRTDSVSSFKAPYSPVSPSLMSVATKSYVSAYGNNQHTDEMAQRPPRQAENYMSSNQISGAHQEGSLKRPNQEEDSQHRDKRQRIDVSQGERMEMDSTITPSNHDRQADASESSSSAGLSSVGQVAKDDFADPFLLCKSSVPRSHPDPQQHLLAAYKLLPLLKTVARNDPETGEKINKLRKSYEGQIKTFSLSGRNKPIKCEREEDEPGPLRALATVTEDEWEGGAGKSKIEVTSDFRAKLEKAMRLQPGTVRNNAHWEDLLGHEKTKPSAAPTPSYQPQQASRVPNGVPRPQQSSAALDKRSTRGKKRSYGDDSFVGYGEGYSEGDEDGDEDEYARRKRKKESFGPTSSFHNTR